jgi:hypothetical protein
MRVIFKLNTSSGSSLIYSHSVVLASDCLRAVPFQIWFDGYANVSSF